MEKYCIFHIPNELDKAGSSGSQVRPRKMLEAFRNIGYNVDYIMGSGEERKKAINKIKEKIEQGKKYDFLYSESSTTATLLTEKDHIPRYPFLDFGFFKYCKKHGVPIGLFYRDIYWKFPIYKEKVVGIKYLVAQMAYRYDLLEYKKYLNVFYVPNKKISAYIKSSKLQGIMRELPPGSTYDPKFIESKEKFYKMKLSDTAENKIHLFYVGGVGSQYNLDLLLRVLTHFSGIELTICCREKEWKEYIRGKEKLISERIHIVHKTGEELEEYYSEADICLAYFEPEKYRDMAMPIKLFEYIAHTTPILASQKTAVGDYVNKYDVGWSVDYSEDCLIRFFQRIKNNYEEIYDKHRSCVSILEKNTWEGRARKVVDDIGL